MQDQYVAADQCIARPDLYKFCPHSICVARDLSCPCQHGVDHRCDDGTCISILQVCDGVQQCPRGEDEISCPGAKPQTSVEDPVPSNLTLVISTVSAVSLLCLVFLLVLCVLLTRRRRTNTSRESQSVTEPLRKRFPAVETESSSDDTPEKPSRARYFYTKYDPVKDCDITQCDCCRDQYKQVELTKSNNTKFWNRHGIVKPVEKCNVDLHRKFWSPDENDTIKKGKYLFRPREKDQNAPHIIENKTDPEMLTVINSYKHFSGQVLLPVTLNFDKDSEHFSDTFATELLCASTPRQAVKNLNLVQRDIDIDGDDSPIGDPPCSFGNMKIEETFVKNSQQENTDNGSIT